MQRTTEQHAENSIPERTGDNRVDPESLDNLKETQRAVRFDEDLVFGGDGENEAAEVELSQEDLREHFEIHSAEIDVGRLGKGR